MPVEVREIVIKGIVTDEKNAGTSPVGGNGQVQNNEEIIRACVEAVLGILKEKAER